MGFYISRIFLIYRPVFKAMFTCSSPTLRRPVVSLKPIRWKFYGNNKNHVSADPTYYSGAC